MEECCTFQACDASSGSLPLANGRNPLGAKQAQRGITLSFELYIGNSGRGLYGLMGALSIKNEKDGGKMEKQVLWSDP